MKNSVTGEKSHGPNTITPQLGDVANILLLVPSLDARDDEACVDLQTITHPDGENVLSVTITQSVDDRMAVWRSQMEDLLPSKIGFISVGTMTRSTTDGGDSGDRHRDALAVDNVADPGDLSAISSAITRYLSVWEKDSNQTILCFHSLTALLQHADQEAVHQFLDDLADRVRSTGAIAHYHCDPTAHRQEALDILTQSVDVVVKPTESDGWSVGRQ